MFKESCRIAELIVLKLQNLKQLRSKDTALLERAKQTLEKCRYVHATMLNDNKNNQNYDVRNSTIIQLNLFLSFFI